MIEQWPTFKFALREDIKDDKRFLPTKAEPLSTGFDVRAAQPDRKPIVIRPGQKVKIPLGFRAFCPDGYFYKLCPRSSSFTKKSLHALYGIIDESYPLELIFAASYLPDISALGSDLLIEFGEAIGQIIPVKRQEMQVKEITNEEIDQLYKERGAIRTGGFGSSKS